VYELAARVLAVQRRAAQPSAPVRLGAAEVDLLGHSVRRGADTFRLLPKEAELLSHLLRHRGTACTRDDLLRAVWGYDATPTTRTVDTHVFQLRQKIERDPARPEVLTTVHGVGYRLL
jgi:two-component system response regulator VicR